MIPEKKKTANNDTALVVHRHAGDSVVVPLMDLSTTLLIMVETNKAKASKME